MSIPQKSLSSLLSLCQKFPQSVEIWQSSDKNKLAQFFRHGVSSFAQFALALYASCFYGNNYYLIKVYCYLRQEILRSVVFVGWLVRLFVNMCVHREFVNSLASRRRDERRSGVAGARATCSRTYLGISGRGVRALKYPVSIQAATKDVRKKYLVVMVSRHIRAHLLLY